MAVPVIKSKQSLVFKHFSKETWTNHKAHRTATAGISLQQCIACALQLDDQVIGIYAGDRDCYKDYTDLFDPIVNEYHDYSTSKKHTSDMDVSHLKDNIKREIPIISTRIRVGRNIEGFGLSPGITKSQRLAVEALMKEVFSMLKGDLAGTYYPLTGMSENIRKQLVEDHFLFKSGDRNLQIAGMERDWPEGRGIFHNDAKTFLVWVNEEDQLRIISMQKGGDVHAVFERLVCGIKAIEDALVKKGNKFSFDDHLGYIHSCPTNLGTGMRASVHVDFKGKWAAKDQSALKARCNELALQPRGAHGETSGDTGNVFDVSNKHRLGYSEVQLVQTMIDGVNMLWAEDSK